MIMMKKMSLRMIFRLRLWWRTWVLISSYFINLSVGDLTFAWLLLVIWMHKRIQGPISLDICPIFFFRLEKKWILLFPPHVFSTPIYSFLLLYKNFGIGFVKFFYFKFRKHIRNEKRIFKYLFNDKKRRLGLERKHGWEEQNMKKNREK
jgi:hypothetical protein